MESRIWGHYCYRHGPNETRLQFGLWQFLLGCYFESFHLQSVSQASTPLGDVLHLNGLPAFSTSFEALLAATRKVPEHWRLPFKVVFPSLQHGAAVSFSCRELAEAVHWLIHSVESNLERLSIAYGYSLFANDDEPDWDGRLTGLRLQGDTRYCYSIRSGVGRLELFGIDPASREPGPRIDARTWDVIPSSNAGDVRIVRRSLDWTVLLAELGFVRNLCDPPDDDVEVTWESA